MRKKIVITLLMLLACVGGFVLLKISTWHAVFLFSKKDLEWLAPYHAGDMVFYASATGMDTMIVTRKLYNTPGRLGLYCFSNFYAEGEYINTIYHNGRRIDCEFIMVKEPKEHVDMTMVFDKRFSVDEQLQVGDTSSVVVEGCVYDDVIILNDGNSSVIEDTETNCEYLYWSKSKGLLQYKYQNGEVYTFYKKLPYIQSWWKRKLIDMF